MLGRHRSVVHILPCAESAARSGQHQHARIAEIAQRVAQLLVHLYGEAVQPVGAVQHNADDWAVRLEVDGLVSHACRLAKEGAWTQTNSRGPWRSGCSPRRAPDLPGV